MAYTPTVWETGDVITAEKLNKAENGIAGAYAYIVNVTADNEGNITGIDASYNDLVANVGKPIIGVVDFGDIGGTFHLPFVTVAHPESAYVAIFAYYNFNTSSYEGIQFSSADADTDMTVST